MFILSQYSGPVDIQTRHWLSSAARRHFRGKREKVKPSKKREFITFINFVSTILYSIKNILYLNYCIHLL